MRKIEYEITEEEEKAAREATKENWRYANQNPELLSLLYDIDLMPEQIRMMANAKRYIAICMLYKKWKEDFFEQKAKEFGPLATKEEIRTVVESILTDFMEQRKKEFEHGKG